MLQEDHQHTAATMTAPNISVPDNLDNWITYPYEENGQHFTVVQSKDRPILEDLRSEGPFESMNRDGRYLIPVNRFRDIVLAPSITAEMFEKQRKLIRYRPSDIVITTFPRSGTTWTEQLVLLMLSRGDPSQIDTRDKNSYYRSRPNRLGKVFFDNLYHNDPDSNIAAPWGVTCGQDLGMRAEHLDAIPFRRVVKTHHCAHMMIGMGEAKHELDKKQFPPVTVDNVKFLWVCRDPKDVVLSLRRINTTNYKKHGIPITPFVKAFLEGKTNRGSWALHTKEWRAYAEKYPNNVLPVSFEESKVDPTKVARKIAQFLDIELTDDELANCVKYSSFEQMKEMQKGAEAEHVHSGLAGGWHDVFSQEIIEAFNKMVSDPALGEYGKRYIYHK